METIFTNETAKINVTRIVAMGLTGRVVNYVMQAVDCTWILTAAELAGMGLPLAFTNYCQQHLTVEERGELAGSISRQLYPDVK